MTVKLMNRKKVEAQGDTVEEAIWELKRNRPDDADFIYPVNPDGPIVGVHVRTGEDHMDVIELTVVEA